MVSGAETLRQPPAMGIAFAKALVPSRTHTARIPTQAAVVEDWLPDAARLAAYSRVCGFTLKDRVPPTWLHVLTFPLHVHLLGHAHSTVRLVGAVHVSNTMTLRRPVLASERLTLQVRAQHLRPHSKGALVDLVGQAHAGDELVWDGVSTYLAQGAVAPGESEEIPRAAFTPAEPQAHWRLRSDLGRRYRQVSHDPNPIHTSRLMARVLGFPRPVIHGMWTHAHALAALEARLPDAYRVEVAFARPIYLPSSVGFHADPRDDGFHAAVTTRDGGKPHMLMRVDSYQG